MTESDAPDPIPSIPPGPPERVRVDGPPPQPRRDFLPALYLLGFLVLAGALFYLYRNPSTPAGVEQQTARVDTLQQQLDALAGRLNDLERQPAPTAEVGPLDARIAALEPRLAALEPRLSAVEQRPAPVPPPDFGPITAQLEASFSKQEATLSKQAFSLQDLGDRLGAVEGRVATAEKQDAASFQGLTDRLGAVEDRVGTAEKQDAASFQGLTDRLGAVEGRVGTAEKQDAASFQGLTDRLGTVEGQVAAADKQDATSFQGLTDRLGTVEGRVAAVEKQGSAVAGQLGGVAERAQRISRTQVAAAALEAGQKLGEIPGAPPALARFAFNAPPTEAGLRLSFNNAAEAAQNASQPGAMEGQPFASRLWTRAQQSLSVRQGDRVVLGDPVAGLLAHARQALEAGDLSGAVSTLDGLTGPAAAAMAGWVSQARALLDARSALATMAARG
jgi:hypothetical protein